MIYELRIYRCVPGRMPALLSRFENETLRIWEKHGILQAGFWTMLVGESSQQRIYMLVWDTMAECDARWSAFLADPEWLAISSESETDSQLVQDISNQLLTPTTCRQRSEGYVEPDRNAGSLGFLELVRRAERMVC